MNFVVGLVSAGSLMALSILRWIGLSELFLRVFSSVVSLVIIGMVVAATILAVRRPETNQEQEVGGIEASEDRSGVDEDRDPKLRVLLDAVRELVEVSDSGRAHALDALEAAARAWAADECSICGRRGDHEWNELTGAQRVAHQAEDASQGR